MWQNSRLLVEEQRTIERVQEVRWGLMSTGPRSWTLFCGQKELVRAVMLGGAG